MSFPSVPHIRLVLPAHSKGRAVSGHPTKAYLTLPGGDEVELPGVRAVVSHVAVDDVVHVALELVATTEIQYGETTT